MAPVVTTSVTRSAAAEAGPIDASQTLRAATALLRKIQTDHTHQPGTAEKPSLLADADDDAGEDVEPVWLILTTKKHIIDQKRLKPGKIQLPHPYCDVTDQKLRICLLTADPQRTYKDLITHPSFPLGVAQRIGRVIGINKLKAKYKSFESRRQLLNEYDIFLADDRIITYLPKVLGKIFYKSGNKRPIPVSLEGKRQNFDEQGNKRRKLSEGGSKVAKLAVKPLDVASEIERALSSALVHLAPSTSTAVKIGRSSMTPQQIQENIEAVTKGLVETFVPQKWRNVRAVHIKGPNTAALPIWMSEELWEDEQDILEHALPSSENEKSKKRKRGALTDNGDTTAESADIIEVPGPDGKMRRLEKPSTSRKTSGKRPAVVPTIAKDSEGGDRAEGDVKAAERAEKLTRKDNLQKQKAIAKGVVDVAALPAEVKPARNGAAKSKGRK